MRKKMMANDDREPFDNPQQERGWNASYRACAQAMRERAANLWTDCICSHPCDDYFCFPTGCPKKIAATIHALPLEGEP
jgi:hypothetical protein